MHGPSHDCKGIVRPRELISIPLSLNSRDHARSIDPFDLPSSGSDGRSSRSVYKAQHYSRNYTLATLRRNKMTEQRFRVGIVGLEPGRGWAARAHVPALRALSDSYEIVGVANTSLASAQRAAAALGLPRAFTDVAELVSAPEVDIVTVTVKVPHHLEVVKAAIEAGKHVYCEWPLGNGLAEAEELAELAKAKSILGVVGTQARVSPEIEYLKQLIMDGFVGEVLSTAIVARGGGWGGSIAQKKSDVHAGSRCRRHHADDPGGPYAGGAHRRARRGRSIVIGARHTTKHRSRGRYGRKIAHVRP